jgi:hypothetical protein
LEPVDLGTLRCDACDALLHEDLNWDPEEGLEEEEENEE